ncbi:MAG TPA: TlpA disulfide reductase family protein [Bacillales bacterium]|nr:TlpA disulfide reductase family protein [Bacillales bacterium]
MADKDQDLEKAPSFSLMEYGTNHEISLDDFRGRCVMLTFWVSWCPDCLKDLPKKEKLFHALKKNRELAFLTVNVTGREGDPEDGLRFVEHNDFQFPVLRDIETHVYDAYRCTSVPYTLLLNPQHEIEKRFDDHASFVEIPLALEQLLAKYQES